MCFPRTVSYFLKGIYTFSEIELEKFASGFFEGDARIVHNIMHLYNHSPSL